MSLYVETKGKLLDVLHACILCPRVDGLFQDIILETLKIIIVLISEAVKILI